VGLLFLALAVIMSAAALTALVKLLDRLVMLIMIDFGEMIETWRETRRNKQFFKKIERFQSEFE
jgi:hypothetical protein